MRRPSWSSAQLSWRPPGKSSGQWHYQPSGGWRESHRRRWVARTAQLACSRPWRATSRPSAAPVSKSSAHGRSALALLRTPPRAACLAQRLCSGASRIRQARRREPPREGSRRQQAARACLRVSDCGSGRQCCHRGSLGCERTMRWLRAEPRIEPVLRSRALGPMLAPPPRERWAVLRAPGSAASRRQCFLSLASPTFALFRCRIAKAATSSTKSFLGAALDLREWSRGKGQRRRPMIISAFSTEKVKGVGSGPGIRFFFLPQLPLGKYEELGEASSQPTKRTWTWREVEESPRPTVGGGLSGETLGVLRAQLGAPTDGGRCSHR